MTEMTWTGFPYDPEVDREKSLSERVKEKLYEFNFSIISNYKIDGTEDNMIITDDMIIAVNDKTRTTAISFEATTRPDIAAKRMLILGEIKTFSEMVVMESYVFENNQLVTGQKAIDIAHKRMGREVINDFVKKQVYFDIMKSEKCFDC
jgi:hypothetical protein